jgi:DNA-binding GntR family transcriptional regulator
MTEANRRFHFALLEASGMPRLVRLVALLNEHRSHTMLALSGVIGDGEEERA